MLNPATHSSSYNKFVKSIRGQSAVECRFPQSSDVTEVIAVQPQLSPVSCEASSGRVNYGGKLVLTVVYCDEEGKLCRMQKGAEFSHFADDDCLAPANECVCTLSCDKLNVKREGSSFVITAVISADISVYARAERTYLAAAEGAHVKSETGNLFSAVCFSGESEIDDDFDADSVADVLIPAAKAVALSAACTADGVEVGGEIYLSLFAIRQQTPVCLERIIPFKCTLPCDDTQPGANAAVNAVINDLNVTATVNEERGKCSVNFTCSLSFNGWFLSRAEEELCIDAFSETNEIIPTFAKESFLSCEGIKVYGERVSGLAASKSRLTYDCTFLAAAKPCAECEYNPVTNAVEGAVITTLIYSQGGEIKSTEVSLPFSVKLTGVADEGQKVVLDVAVCGVSVRLKQEGEAEAEANLKVCATVIKSEQTEYIEALEEGEPLELNQSAVSVFMPAAGDGLWDIAKRLKKSPSDVAAANKQLKFPLTGKERILIYRAKKA